MPNPSDYNFDAPGELERYVHDMQTQAATNTTSTSQQPPQQSLSEQMSGFKPSQWASDRGLGDMEKLINFKQALPPEFLQHLMQNSSAPSGDPQDMWNDFVRRQQYNPSSSLTDSISNFVKNPANLFFAGTTGQGGMTLANAATGGDVGQGVQTDLAALGGTAAGAGAAALGAGGMGAGAAAGGTGNFINSGGNLGATAQGAALGGLGGGLSGFMNSPTDPFTNLGGAEGMGGVGSTGADAMAGASGIGGVEGLGNTPQSFQMAGDLPMTDVGGGLQGAPLPETPPLQDAGMDFGALDAGNAYTSGVGAGDLTAAGAAGAGANVAAGAGGVAPAGTTGMSALGLGGGAAGAAAGGGLLSSMGGGAAAGGASGLLNNALNQYVDPAARGAYSFPTADILSSGIGMAGAQSTQNVLQGLFDKMMTADPWNSQMGRYQQPLYDAATQGIGNTAYGQSIANQVSRQDSAKGYNFSGNMLHDLAQGLNTGTTQYMQALSPLAMGRAPDTRGAGAAALGIGQANSNFYNSLGYGANSLMQGQQPAIGQNQSLGDSLGSLGKTIFGGLG